MTLGDSVAEFGGLALDTSVYKQHRLAFDKGLLLKLEQFRSGSASLLVSEVVRRELGLHLEMELSDARSKATRALRLSRPLVGDEALGYAEGALNLGSLDTSALAIQKIEEHFLRTGAKTVPVQNATIDCADVLNRYFSREPPFSEGKKKEFPDAFTLLSLESWAISNSTRVLVVSKDPDWKAFCDSSPHLELDSELSSAIGRFQSPDLRLRQSVISLMKDEPDTAAAIEVALRRELEEFDCDIEATFSDRCEIDTPDITLVSYELDRDAHGDPVVECIPSAEVGHSEALS